MQDQTYQFAITGRGQYSSSFWIAALFVLCTFALGGSSRVVTPLLVLRPIAAVALVFGCIPLSRNGTAPFAVLIAILIACALLAAAQLVPLPYAIWSGLPGRDLAVSAGDITGVGHPWRPLSMVPHKTWNALFSLIVPAATVILAIGCSRNERGTLVQAVLAIGALVVAIAVVQVITGARWLYLFKVTTISGAVGPFANRNHLAAFLACLLPMMNYAAATKRGRGWALVALPGSLFLFALIIVAGSRAGLLLGLLGLIAAASFWLPGQAAARARPSFRSLGAMAILVCLLAWLAWFAQARADAITRLFDTIGEKRIRA